MTDLVTHRLLDLPHPIPPASLEEGSQSSHSKELADEETLSTVSPSELDASSSASVLSLGDDPSVIIRPSPLFERKIEPVHLDPAKIQRSYLAALKINLLLLVPAIGAIAFLIAHLAIRIFYTYYQPSDEEKSLAASIQGLRSGLSDIRIKKLARFILDKNKSHIDGESKHYIRSNFLGFAGTLPRDVLELPDGRFVIRIYSRVIGTNEETLHRGIIVDPKHPQQTSFVHIRQTKEGLDVLDAYAPHLLGNEDTIKPVDCFIVNGASDLSLLYPTEIERTESHEFVDIAFHAYQKRSSIFDYIVSVGENIGSWGNVNCGVVHVDMIQGRYSASQKETLPDGTKKKKDHLIIASATGVQGTFLEYRLDITDPQQFPDGAELHIFRFKRSEVEGLDPEEMLRVMHQFARRQVNQLKLPTGASKPTESDSHMASTYHQGFIGGLYSNSDAASSPFSSIRYDERAIDRVALSAADELLGQRRQTMDNKYLGGICSSFTALTLQIGHFLSAFTREDKQELLESAQQAATEELTPQLEQLKVEILQYYGISTEAFRARYAEILLAISKTALDRPQEFSALYFTLIALLSENGETPKNRSLKNRLQKIYQNEFGTAMKRKLFQLLKDILLKAETKSPAGTVSPTQAKLQHIVRDPIFRLNSRWILPSTLHGLMARHMTERVQIVPPKAIPV